MSRGQGAQKDLGMALGLDTMPGSWGCCREGRPRVRVMPFMCSSAAGQWPRPPSLPGDEIANKFVFQVTHG